MRETSEEASEEEQNQCVATEGNAEEEEPILIEVDTEVIEVTEVDIEVTEVDTEVTEVIEVDTEVTEEAEAEEKSHLARMNKQRFTRDLAEVKTQIQVSEN